MGEALQINHGSNLETISSMHWRRRWHPTPVLLPGKSHGWRSLVGCSPWGGEESDMTSLSLSIFTFMHWRQKWPPTPVFLPGESQGRGSLVGCRLWGRTESDTTEVTQHSIAYLLGCKLSIYYMSSLERRGFALVYQNFHSVAHCCNQLFSSNF